MNDAAPTAAAGAWRELVPRGGAPLPSTEDLLAATLPLLRQVADLHGRGLVAPLDDLDALHQTGGRLWFENARAHPPRDAGAAVAAVARAADAGGALEIAARWRRTDEDGASRLEDLRIAPRGAPVEHPVYLPGYAPWERALGHHDPLSDIFVLGALLAALATGRDLDDAEELREVVAAREDLTSLNPALHPVVALVIARMTELDRHRREPDLAAAIATLERRREQDALRVVDLTRFRSFVLSRAGDRRERILAHLQSRLHDRSRRNRLLHFRATGGTLDLTASSVPLVLDVASIDPAALLTCASGRFLDDLLRLKPIVLSRWLRFEDYPYIAPALDRIRLDAARDAAEYGFSQLRLVACFLHWHDLKNEPDERIASPLLLVPVRVTRRRGVRDAHLVEATAEIAEVNPVLRHHLAQLYGLALPESVDLSAPGALDELYRALAEQIAASEPAVVLEKIDRPRIDLVQAIARRRLELHQQRARLTGRGVRTLLGFDYAYGRERRAPLGAQLFERVVSPSPAPQRDLLEEPRPASSG